MTPTLSPRGALRLLFILYPLFATSAMGATAKEGERPALVLQEPGFSSAIAIDPSGEFLATRYLGAPQLYSLQARALIGSVPGVGQTSHMEFAGSGRWLLLRAMLAGVYEEHSFLFDPRARKVVHVFDDWDVAMAPRANVGLALKVTARGMQARAFHADTGVVDDASWDLDFRCDRAAVRDDGAVAVAVCGQRVVVFDLRTRAKREVPLDGALPHVGDEQGVWLTAAGNALAIDSTWVDLASGAVHPPAKPPTYVAGIFGGAKPYLLALDGQRHVVTVDPSGAVREGPEIPAGTSALALDEARGVYVLGMGGPLWLFDRQGRAVAQIGGRLRPVMGVITDPTTDRLFARVDIGQSRMPLVEVDLREAESRIVPAEGPAPSLLLKTDPGPLSIIDERSERFERVAIAGLEEKGARTLARPSSDELWVEQGGQWVFVDLARRTVTRRMKRPKVGEVVAAQRARSGELLVLDAAGTFSALDPQSGKVLATHDTRWKTEPGKDSPVTWLQQLTSGQVLAAGQNGLFIAPSPRRPEFTQIITSGFIESLVVSPDGGRFAFAFMKDMAPLTGICSSDQGLVKLDACAVVYGREPRFLRGGQALVVSTPTGLSLFDLDKKVKQADVAFGEGGAALFLTPEGDYKGSVDALELAVAVQDGKARFLDEVDGQLNHPSAVLRKLGRAEPERIAFWQELEAQRGEEPKATDASHVPPNVRVLSPPPVSIDQPVLTVPVRVEAGTPSSLHLHVRVNGVPIFGRGGKDLGSFSTGEKSRDVQVPIPIGPGDNRIAITVSDAAGSEAFGDSFVVTGTGQARAGKLYFLGIGVSKYADAKRSLTYAAKDVGDVARTVQALGGKSVEVKLLLDGDATHPHIAAARAFLEQARIEDMVVVYLAGHGLLAKDGGWYFGAHDVSFEDPSKGGVSFAELEALVDGLGAGSKVMFIDACHAGEGTVATAHSTTLAKDADGARGATVVARGAGAIDDANDSSTLSPRDRERVEQTFADLRRGTGATVIAAASQAEFAFESASTHNGLFTHAVLQALREGEGVRERGELWLPDLLRVVRAHVVQLSRGHQTPQIRNGNVAFRRPVFRSPPVETLYTPKTPEFVQRAVVTPQTQAVWWLTESGVHVVAVKDSAYFATALPETPCTGCTLQAPLHAYTPFLISNTKTWAFDVRKTWVALPAESGRPVAFSGDGKFVLGCGAHGLVVTDVAKRTATPLADAWCGSAEAWSEPLKAFVSIDDRHLTKIDPANASVTIDAAIRVPEGSRAEFDERGQVVLLRAQDKVTVVDLVTHEQRERSVPSQVADSFVFEDTRGALRAGRDVDGYGMGARVALVDPNGNASLVRAVRPEHVLVRGDQLIVRSQDDQSALAPGSFDLFGDLQRTGSLFVVSSVRDASPSSWFGVPEKDPILLEGPGDTLLVVSRATGAISRIDVPH